MITTTKCKIYVIRYADELYDSIEVFGRRTRRLNWARFFEPKAQARRMLPWLKRVFPDMKALRPQVCPVQCRLELP